MDLLPQRTLAQNFMKICLQLLFVDKNLLQRDRQTNATKYINSKVRASLTPTDTDRSIKTLPIHIVSVRWPLQTQAASTKILERTSVKLT